MIQISDQELMDSVVTLKKAANSNVIESMTDLAKALKEDEGNPKVADAIAGCVKAQRQFNEYTESMSKYISAVEETIEAKERIEKLMLTNVEAKDGGFQTKTIDAGAIRV